MSCLQAGASRGQGLLRRRRLDYATGEEDKVRRGDLMRSVPIGGQDRGGGSTWQSLARGGAVEADYLNGEIVLLGRLHGVPTPVNELLQRRRNAAARDKATTGERPDRGAALPASADLLFDDEPEAASPQLAERRGAKRPSEGEIRPEGRRACARGGRRAWSRETWRPFQMAWRVSAGSMTSSTWAWPAAMYGSMFLRSSSAMAMPGRVALLALGELRRAACA